MAGIDELIRLAQFRQQQDLQSNPLSSFVGGLQKGIEQQQKVQQQVQEAQIEQQKQAILAEEKFKRQIKVEAAKQGIDLFDFATTPPFVPEQSQIPRQGKIIKRARKSEDNILSKFAQKKQRQILQEQQLEVEKKETELQNKKFDQSNTLRDDYTKEATDFFKVQDSFGRIIASAENPSPAGDLALIFNYMKILDPGSVVRESEFKNAATAQQITERFGLSWEAIKRVWSGERLSAEARDDFIDRAGKLFKVQENIQLQRNDLYSNRAKQAGLDPFNVVQKPFDFNTGGKREVTVTGSVSGTTPTGETFTYRRTQ